MKLIALDDLQYLVVPEGTTLIFKSRKPMSGETMKNLNKYAHEWGKRHGHPVLMMSNDWDVYAIKEEEKS